MTPHPLPSPRGEGVKLGPLLGTSARFPLIDPRNEFSKSIKHQSAAQSPGRGNEACEQRIFR
jgi:hypothetical protein